MLQWATTHFVFKKLRESDASLLKASVTETTRSKNWILANGAATIEAMMGFGWGNVRISMACYVLNCLGPSLLWACCTFAVLGIFFFNSNVPVAFGCSGHLFRSWHWACWTSANYGIFHVVQMGKVRFGSSGYLFPV